MSAKTFHFPVLGGTFERIESGSPFSGTPTASYPGSSYDDEDTVNGFDTMFDQRGTTQSIVGSLSSALTGCDFLVEDDLPSAGTPEERSVWGASVASSLRTGYTAESSNRAVRTPICDGEVGGKNDSSTFRDEQGLATLSTPSAAAIRLLESVKKWSRKIQTVRSIILGTMKEIDKIERRITSTTRNLTKLDRRIRRDRSLRTMLKCEKRSLRLHSSRFKRWKAVGALRRANKICRRKLASFKIRPLVRCHTPMICVSNSFQTRLWEIYVELPQEERLRGFADLRVFERSAFQPL